MCLCQCVYASCAVEWQAAGLSVHSSQRAAALPTDNQLTHSVREANRHDARSRAQHIPPLPFPNFYMARLAVPAGLGLIAIVVAVCINTVHASRNVTIGWLGPTSGPYASFLSPCLYATWRAIDVANAANLIPGTTLQLVVGDSATDNTQTLAATYQLVQPQAKGGAGAVAIVGEFFSSLTILAAEVLNPYKTALVSPSATATDFSVQHSSNFPYFVGAQPNNAFQALQISQFVKANGWKRVAMLFTTDSYGSSGAAATAVELTKLGIDIVVSTSCSSKTDVDFSLDRIAATTARIIIYVSFAHQDALHA